MNKPYPEKYTEMRKVAAEFTNLLIKLGIDDFSVSDEVNISGNVIGLEVKFPIVDAKSTEAVEARLSISEDIWDCSVFSFVEEDK